LTLCDDTERTNPSKLPPALARLMAGQWKKGAIPPKWDGKTAARIVEHLERVLERY
jgi:UDP-N-acetylglucosamine 2-epimerase (non-hydrolysing)